ncbi:MAG: hypothetical protein O7A67_00660, partial [SAR324 cluster bacterium]|nr:hypothetical protein [SAR324 cluster bacterium]
PDWNATDRHQSSAVTVGEEDGAKPNVALTHFRYAECLHKKGDLDTAREQLDRAEALFRDMGMDWWTEQAEGLRGRLDGGEKFVWFAPYVDGPPKVE